MPRSAPGSCSLAYAEAAGYTSVRDEKLADYVEGDDNLIREGALEESKQLDLVDIKAFLLTKIRKTIYASMNCIVSSIKASSLLVVPVLIMGRFAVGGGSTERICWSHFVQMCIQCLQCGLFDMRGGIEIFIFFRNVNVDFKCFS